MKSQVNITIRYTGNLTNNLREITPQSTQSQPAGLKPLRCKYLIVVING